MARQQVATIAIRFLLGLSGLVFVAAGAGLAWNHQSGGAWIVFTVIGAVQLLTAHFWASV